MARVNRDVELESEPTHDGFLIQGVDRETVQAFRRFIQRTEFVRYLPDVELEQISLFDLG